jgi:anthranilate phosphoribosyltransferase
MSGALLATQSVAAELEELLEGGVEPARARAMMLRWNEFSWNGALLAAAARVVRRRGVAIRPTVTPLVDTCGTGGDGAGTINLSTAVAFVVAAAGGAVAKHGNRAVSSVSGSADVLTALGAAIEVSPESATRLLDATGFAFLFAPRFHPALRHVGAVRRELRVRTLFNVLGPLANPAGAQRQLVGVFEPSLTRPVCEALRELGGERALVVHCEGLDELGLHAPTTGHRLEGGAIEPFRCDPAELGLERAPLDALRGAAASVNAVLVRAALTPQRGRASSAQRDAVLLNAAAALWVAGLAAKLSEGLALARATVERGDALRTVDRFVESSRRLAASERSEEARA